MKTRRFGRTGLEVSEMVFGGGFVGGIVIHADDDTKRAAIRRAFDAGVNWIDTAPLYGQGRSEEALGWLLAEVDETPYLSTKVGLDLDALDDIPGQVERSMTQSLKRLRRDSVDLLQLHNAIGPETGDGRIGVDRVLGPGGVADALDRLRGQGLTRFTGLTALGDASACRAAIESGRFDSAQVYYNLLNPSAARAMPAAWTGHDFSGVIAACSAHDVAVMNIRVFAAGVIPTDARHGREVVLTEDSEVAVEEKRVGAVFDLLGGEFGSRGQTAIRHSLANPDIACVVVGLAELAHIDEAAGGFAAGPLPAPAVARLDDVYAANFGLA
jgi:aryl-alcohol dehydrogenase-like predicted oxidoreductase